MENLVNALKNKANEEIKKVNNIVDTATDVHSQEQLNWMYRIYAPKSRIKWDKMNEEQKNNYIVSKKTKEIEKQLFVDLQKIEDAKTSEDVNIIIIRVEWKRSRIWGSNPTAEVEVRTESGYFHYQGGSIGGCGYDKESTAISEQLNQSNKISKLLYAAKNNDISKSNECIFGYGMNTGILPSFSGGCGVSCYRRNFEAIGMKFEHLTGGKSFDVYQVIKL